VKVGPYYDQIKILFIFYLVLQKSWVILGKNLQADVLTIWGWNDMVAQNTISNWTIRNLGRRDHEIIKATEMYRSKPWNTAPPGQVELKTCEGLPRHADITHREEMAQGIGQPATPGRACCLHRRLATEMYPQTHTVSKSVAVPCFSADWVRRRQRGGEGQLGGGNAHHRAASQVSPLLGGNIPFPVILANVSQCTVTNTCNFAGLSGAMQNLQIQQGVHARVLVVNKRR
jgi:hypothetical protein